MYSSKQTKELSCLRCDDKKLKCKPKEDNRNVFGYEEKKEEDDNWGY